MEVFARRVLSIALLVLLSSGFVSLIPVASGSSSGNDVTPIPGYRLVSSAPSDLPVVVNLQVPLRNTGLLSSLVEQVSDPTSQMYRHFLTPAQLANDFEPTEAFEAMMAYIGTTGLKVDQTALDSVILLQGTASQVSAAFGTTIELFSNGTSTYYAMTGPSTFQGSDIFISNMTALIAKPSLAFSPADNATTASGYITPPLLQEVYNVTSLYAKGVTGIGQSIGILDFLGSPTIRSDLAAFDYANGFPNSTLTIAPIGPYDPNLGAAYGWNSEISLDVEISHSMAPGADQTLYVANEGATLATILGVIVQDDKVTSLSQSFTFPEWEYSYFGTSVFVPYGVASDQMYEMGALEGITFSGATGDAGGAGFSTGPLGDVGYPSSSPFVTAMGGTQIYGSSNGGVASYEQTAYSDLGFVPDFSNDGGSGGGVSTLEPRPWYQSNQSGPASYPDGRMVPDLSLQSGIFPGTLIVISGEDVVIGGTSEASPLFAGMTALTAADLGTRLGLLNPSIYAIGNNPAASSKVFLPITFGYTIPWVPEAGYNLATGWGALNVGEFASELASMVGGSRLAITVNDTGAVDSEKLEYTPGTTLHIAAGITKSGLVVSTGSFSATLYTLQGSGQSTSLSYNATTGKWDGAMVIGDESGITDVRVSGQSGGSSGSGEGVVFLGYLGQFGLLPTTPYTASNGGLYFSYASTTLDEFGSPDSSATLAVSTYSISGNHYLSDGSITGNSTSSGIYFFDTVENFPAGDTEMIGQGDSYGYLPLVMGIYLQNSLIYPETIIPPGSVAPGESISIWTAPEAPYNIDYFISENTGSTVGSDVRVGSNVTATLVSPLGAVVSTATLSYGPCTQGILICGGAYGIDGQLPVPPAIPSGLYTVMLYATYDTSSLTTPINGSFFGQIWVSDGVLSPQITVGPGTLYEGQNVNVTADIRYPNGSEVTHGLFAAVVYPHSLQSFYSQIEEIEYSSLEMVALNYSPATNRWVGTATLPSPADAGVLNPIDNGIFDYSGPYDALVTGISYDGFTTSSSLAAEVPFYVQPYTLASSAVSSIQQPSGMAFRGTTISASGALSDDLFLGSNTVRGGTLEITDSQINGTLTVTGEDLTLTGVSGGDIVAQNSTLVLHSSDVSSLQLTSSTVKLIDSSYSSISPALPSVDFVSPARGQVLSSQFNVSLAVQGQDLSNATVLLDGVPIGSATGSLGGAQEWGPVSPPDGTHLLTLSVTQSDGITSTFSDPFSTNLGQSKLTAELQSADSLIQTLNNELGATNRTLNSTKAALSQTTDLLYAVAAVAVVALVLAVVLSRRRPLAPATPPQV